MKTKPASPKPKLTQFQKPPINCFMPFQWKPFTFLKTISLNVEEYFSSKLKTTQIRSDATVCFACHSGGWIRVTEPWHISDIGQQTILFDLTVNLCFLAEYWQCLVTLDKFKQSIFSQGSHGGSHRRVSRIPFFTSMAWIVTGFSMPIQKWLEMCE